MQQGHEFAGAGKPVLHQAVMGQFGQFLDADAGEAKDLHGGPGPERPAFFAGEVAAPAVGGVLGPDVGRVARVVTARRRVRPSAVNTSRGGGLRGGRRSRLAVRPLSTAATRAGRTGSRSRVRWSMRDLRRSASLRWGISPALTGQGRPTVPTGPGRPVAHWAMSR